MAVYPWGGRTVFLCPREMAQGTFRTCNNRWLASVQQIQMRHPSKSCLLFTLHTVAGRINVFALGFRQKSDGTQKACGFLNRRFFQIPSVVTGDHGRKWNWLERDWLLGCIAGRKCPMKIKINGAGKDDVKKQTSSAALWIHCCYVLTQGTGLDLFRLFLRFSVYRGVFKEGAGGGQIIPFPKNKQTGRP